MLISQEHLEDKRGMVQKKMNQNLLPKTMKTISWDSRGLTERHLENKKPFVFTQEDYT